MSSTYDLLEEDFIHETLLSTSNIQDDDNKFPKKTMNSTYDLMEEDFIHETPLLTSNIQDDDNNFLKKTMNSSYDLVCYPFLIKSGNRKPGETPLQTTIWRQATSFWQSAEWGMRAVQGSFPHCKDKFLLSESNDDRKVFLHMITMLHNFRTRHVGLNQLSSTYYPAFVSISDDALDVSISLSNFSCTLTYIINLIL